MHIAKIIKTYIIILLLALIVTGAAYAATTLEVGIPGQINPGSDLPSVPVYIKYLYLFVLGFVGIAGFASIAVWGAVWAGSGVVDKKAAALDGIKNALYGIGIALTAFIILNTINPDLTVIKAPSVAPVNIPKYQTSTGSGVWLCPNDSKQGYKLVESTHCPNIVATCSSGQATCWIKDEILSAIQTNTQTAWMCPENVPTTATRYCTALDYSGGKCNPCKGLIKPPECLDRAQCVGIIPIPLDRPCTGGSC